MSGQAKRKPKSFDQRSYDLAEHFLFDIPGATADEHNELAEAIQQVCEDHCAEFERRRESKVTK